MKVSIIIPIYNVASYIENCIKSVMAQSYAARMECILIDDCGTDDSIFIVKRLIADYDGSISFKIIHHERNRGLSAARNTGIDNAIGEYLYFLDGDDEISNDCIELLMRKVEEDDTVELVQGNTKTVPVNNVENMTVKIKTLNANTNDAIRESYYKSGQFIVNAWNKLIKCSFVQNHHLRFIEGMLFEDYIWTFQLMKHLKNVSFVPKQTYVYKRHDGSIVTATDNKIKAEHFKNIYNYILTNITSGHERDEYNFYAKKFSYFNARYARFLPSWKEDYMEWNKKAKEYCGFGVRLQLSISRISAMTRCGWLLFSLMYRIEHPRVITGDVKAIIKRLKTIYSTN